ncbi:small basic protein [Thermoproteota archaeon]
MSIHPSLGSASKGKQQRTVLKRAEKIKHLMEKGKWDDKNPKVYGLPKIKMLKLKIAKKEKAAEKPEEEGAAVETTETKAPVEKKAEKK